MKNNMKFPDINIKGTILGIPSEFSFAKSYKKNDRSHYKLSMIADYQKVSKAWADTKLLASIEETLVAKPEETKFISKDAIIQIQVIFKPNYIEKKNELNEAEVTKIKEENKANEEKLSNLLADSETLNGEPLIAKQEEIKNTLAKIDKNNEKLESMGVNNGSNLSQNSLFVKVKDFFSTNVNSDGKNNTIWVLAVKVDFKNALENKRYNIDSCSLIFSSFGDEVSSDDKQNFIDKIKFTDTKVAKDVTNLQIQEIIDQNKFLREFIEKQVIKTKPEEGDMKGNN